MPNFAQWGNDLYTGRRSYDIVGRRNLWYTAGVVVFVASVLLLLVKGLNPGIEFRGGSEFRVTGVSDTSETLAVDTIEETIGEGVVPRVSVIGDDSVRVQTERLSDEETTELGGALAEAYGVDAGAVTTSFVGPSWGQDVTSKALRALVIFLILVAVVIAMFFRNWQMAVAALVALLHDVVITVGIYAAVGFEVTPATVIGFLTILGYSLYDTVVVFDKVRENTEHVLSGNRRTLAEAANLAVNQTLVRSINTSVVATLPVAAILFIGAFLLGAGTLKDISLALFIGIVVGTYSSIFLATPLWVHLRSRDAEVREQARRVAARRASDARQATEKQEAGTAPTAAPAGTATAVLERTETESRPAASQAGRGPRNQPRRGPRGRRGGPRR
ncbi:MAG: protein translocase subunit SecF [Actinomycetes bacterium]